MACWQYLKKQLFKGLVMDMFNSGTINKILKICYIFVSPTVSSKAPIHRKINVEINSVYMAFPLFSFSFFGLI
jgi:hypothetical protein